MQPQQEALIQENALDGPGKPAFFHLARKDGLGTARNTTSRVWFTLANGVLSDVYYPTIDNTNTRTLQYIVTDGHTFTDLQEQDMVYTVEWLHPPALACRVTSTARNGRYRIITEYFADPGRNCVVASARFEPLVGHVTDYQLYVHYDPLINGHGGGGAANGGGDTGLITTIDGRAIAVAFDHLTASNAVHRDYAMPVYSALAASLPFLAVSTGFSGTQSDGLVQLLSAQRLTTLYRQSSDGNIVQTAQVDLSQEGHFILALGFGHSLQEAVSTVRATLEDDLEQIRTTYIQEWLSYSAQLISPRCPEGVSTASWSQALERYYLSVNIVKAAEDKTFPGAIVAGLASLWGQGVPACEPERLFFGSYREVFARDLYHAWTALYLAGDKQSASDIVSFLFTRQQLPDGSFPRNSLLNGKITPDCYLEYAFGRQLDEIGYPILMASQLDMTDADFYARHIKPAANFIISHGPAWGVERWEEQEGYSPSTIAVEIAALVEAAHIAQVNDDLASAHLWLGIADDWQQSIEKWTVTTTGALAFHPYFIRVAKTGRPDEALAYDLRNGGAVLDQRTVIDASFLELVRLGIKSASDPLISASLAVVDTTIKGHTRQGDGWLRYNGDGYGDGAQDGHPWEPSHRGNGHIWPLLTAERGEYEIERGDLVTAFSLLQTLARSGFGVGLIPEQIWEFPDLAPSPPGTDPARASIGFRNGEAAGSATPLIWAEAAYARLLCDISAQKILERPAHTYERYIKQRPAKTKLLLLPSDDQSAVEWGSLKIAGLSQPGNAVHIAVTCLEPVGQTALATVTVEEDGSFRAIIELSMGTSMVHFVAANPSGAAAHIPMLVQCY